VRTGSFGSGSARRALGALCLLFSGCAAPDPAPMQIAGPRRKPPSQEIGLRLLESGRQVDLDRARRELAAYFEAPLAEGLFEARTLSLEDLPAPFGCAWLRVDDEVQTLRCLETPLGRLVLCRTDDGADLHLSDFDQIAPEHVDGESAVRLVIRPDRRRALEQLTRQAQDSALLFVAGRTVYLAASVEAPVEGDMMLVGLETGPARSLLDGR